MKTTKPTNILMSVVLFAMAICCSSCGKDIEMPEPPPLPENSIAYIYKGDNKDGLAFKTLLEGNKCAVTLISKNDIASVDFAGYKMIVLDNNTDVAEGGTHWTDVETNKLKDVKKPMLLIGIGGLQFAEKIGNTSRYGNAAQWNDKGFLVGDNTSKLYTTPKRIDIPASSAGIHLYNTAVPGCGQHIAPGSILNGNIYVGKFFTAADYYPVTVERNRYMNFGFQKGVSEMNQTGKDFIVNLCYYTADLTL
ncbi:MAG: hypothetical protein V4722_22420 [Bacteroidota bacterium]